MSAEKYSRPMVLICVLVLVVCSAASVRTTHPDALSSMSFGPSMYMVFAPRTATTISEQGIEIVDIIRMLSSVPAHLFRFGPVVDVPNQFRDVNMTFAEAKIQFTGSGRTESEMLRVLSDALLDAMRYSENLKSVYGAVSIERTRLEDTSPGIVQSVRERQRLIVGCRNARGFWYGTENGLGSCVVATQVPAPTIIMQSPLSHLQDTERNCTLFDGDCAVGWSIGAIVAIVCVFATFAVAVIVVVRAKRRRRAIIAKRHAELGDDTTSLVV